MQNKEWIKQYKNTGLVLTPLADSFVSKSPFIELVRVDYFYALDQNGKRWVVKKWRERFDEPPRYKVFDGRIRTEIESLSVQEVNIVKQLEYDAAATGIIIKEIQERVIVSWLKNQINLDPYHQWLVEEERVAKSIDHPLQFFVGLPSKVAEALTRICKEFFPDEKFIQDFIDREKGTDGVLAFIGRRKFKIIYN